MRKIVSGLFISLDGVTEEPNEWMGPWFNDELGTEVSRQIAANDAMLLGRVTYADFAAHWPQQTDPMADTMNNFRKYVVSNTLSSASWQNSVLINGDVKAEIEALKQEPGKNIGMTGSATLVEWALREGLLDELHLFVIPVVIGEGKRLFGSGSAEHLPVKLLGSEAYQTGVVHLSYAPR